MENELFDKLCDDDIELSILGESHTQKGKYHLHVGHEKVCQKLSIQQIGLILSKLPSTDKSKVYVGDSEEIQMDYKVGTHRGYRDSYSTLSISYIHDKYDVTLELPIEPNKELNGFFANSSRKVENSEITTYYIVSRPNRKAKDVTVPLKVFANGEYVRFTGGYVKSKSEWAANNIIEAIKEVYLKSIESYEK
jgi:hypothetical protein